MERNLVIASVLFTIFALTPVLAQQQQQQQPETELKRVLVTVYYEALCKDSQDFIVKQLSPTLNGKVGKYVDLQLVPYGKSKYVRDDSYVFKCPHGPQECEGNKIQACAIAKIDGGNNSTGLGFNKHTLAFVTCLMDKTNTTTEQGKFPINECGIASGATTKWSDIDNCAHHTEGSELLVNYDTKTVSLIPSLKNVPTILFNEKFSEEDNKEAQKNLEGVICRYVGLVDCATESSTGIYTAAVVLVLLCQTLIRLF